MLMRFALIAERATVSTTFFHADALTSASTFLALLEKLGDNLSKSDPADVRNVAVNYCGTHELLNYKSEERPTRFSMS
jgi:hypothetical protein